MAENWAVLRVDRLAEKWAWQMAAVKVVCLGALSAVQTGAPMVALRAAARVLWLVDSMESSTGEMTVDSMVA